MVPLPISPTLSRNGETANNDLGLRPDTWPGLELDALVSFYIVRSLAYGFDFFASDDSAVMGEAHAALTKFVLERAGTRAEWIAAAVADAAQPLWRDLGDRASTHASVVLMPIVRWGESHAVVSGASLEVAQNAGTEADPLAAARFLVDRVADTSLEPFRRAAILTGILQIGDPRVRTVLHDVWPALDRRVAECVPGPVMVTPVAIEFAVEWAGWCLDQGDERGLAAPFHLLSEHARRAETEGVVEIRRVLPVRLRTDLRQSAVTLVRRWSRQEYGALLRDRLARIYARESEEPLADLVQAWWTESFDVPPFSAAYRIAKAERGDTAVRAEGCAHLRQAMERGDPYASRLLAILGRESQ